MGQAVLVAGKKRKEKSEQRGRVAGWLSCPACLFLSPTVSCLPTLSHQPVCSGSRDRSVWFVKCCCCPSHLHCLTTI